MPVQVRLSAGSAIEGKPLVLYGSTWSTAMNSFALIQFLSG
ncbi:uncharacterized protein METZ01_LOCUS421817, partial [marine metagenome]